jgi:iron complex transport system permease protein
VTSTSSQQARRARQLPGPTRQRRWLLVGGVVLLVLSVVSLFVGVADLDWQTVWISRIPRLVAVLLAGAALSVAG